MKPLALMSRARSLRTMTSTAAAGCALGAVVAVPGLPGPPAAAPPPSPPVAVPPIILVVRLSTDFSPDTLRLAVGQQFELIVSDSVDATGPGIPSTCPGGTPGEEPGAALFAQCVGNGSYLFTAEQPGSIVLSATVRPRCAPGVMCPQWIAEPNLAITITPGAPARPGAAP
jgi:hypothetical protein